MMLKRRRRAPRGPSPASSQATVGRARTTGRALQKQQTREHLYFTAMQLFETSGYERVGVDDIVEAAGVARGTFYFHFPTKDDLLVDAVRRGEQRILTRIAQLGPAAPLREVFSATIAEFIDDWRQRRSLLPFVGTVAMRRIAGERTIDTEPLRLELGRRVERAQARGELRLPLPGIMLADIFLLNAFAALMSWSTTGKPAPEIMLPGIVELFFGGARGLARLSKQTRKKGERKTARRD
jgi:AcrR family transcriptional regulator